MVSSPEKYSLEAELSCLLFARLIHRCPIKKQRPGPGYNSIGRMEQISIGVNTLCLDVLHVDKVNFASVPTILAHE